MKKMKNLSFGSIILLGINGIIGSGIFLLPGTMYQESGTLSILAILLAGISTLLIAMNYAVMASKVDDEGGAFAYAYRAFGKLAGLQTGWFGWLLGVITISAEIAAFMTVMKSIFPSNRELWFVYGIPAGIILTITAINIMGTSVIKVIDNLSSFVKVALLMAFIGIANVVTIKSGMSMTKISTGESGGFVATFSTAFYMFTGFSFLPVAAKQMNNPEKAIPRALIICIVGVGLVYALVQLTLIMIQGTALSGDAMPIATVFSQLFGSLGKGIVLTGIMISTLGVALAVSFDTSAGLASLSQDEHLLPKIIGKQSKQGVSYVAILLTMALALLLILSGSYLFLVKLIVLSSFIQYVATILSVFKLRNDKTLPVGMKLPFGLLIPIVSLLIIIYLLFSFNWLSLMLAFAASLTGYVVYWINSKTPI